MSTKPKTVEMIRRGAPHLIHSDAQLETYTQELFALTAIAQPTQDESEAIALLSLLIETYEQQRFALAPASAAEVLEYLMQSNGLRQKDMTELGGEANVSLILNGKRSLTVKHISALAERFSISPAAFLGPAATSDTARRAA